MKMYATTTSERASKGQGGNDQLDISLAIGSTANSKQVLRILARVLPKEASISDKESVVIQIMKEDNTGFIREITERLVYSLPSCIEITSREQALALKGKDWKMGDDIDMSWATIRTTKDEKPHIHKWTKLSERENVENLNKGKKQKGNLCNCGMNAGFHSKQSNCI